MAAENKIEKKGCSCPYCDADIAEAAFPYCQACEVEVTQCPQCREAVRSDKQVCSNCGALIKE